LTRFGLAGEVALRTGTKTTNEKLTQPNAPCKGFAMKFSDKERIEKGALSPPRPIT
jgi:hypothetical protein